MQKLTYDEAFAEVRVLLDKRLRTSPPPVREYMNHLSLSVGKAIRASAVLVAAMDDKDQIDPGAVYGAAAIEIVHLASLVHDDVMDNADLRRGQETLQKKYGPRRAVICGDYLLGLGLKLMKEVPVPKDAEELELPDYISRLCMGEMLQHMNNDNLDLRGWQYMKIIAGKTAALFEASFYGGALLSGCDREELASYKSLGHYVGMIFQLRDDCLDFEGTREQAGKPIRSDFEQGVITLPLIHAFDADQDLREAARAGQVRGDKLGSEVGRLGGLDFTKGIIKRYYTKGQKRLDAIKLSDQKKSYLRALLQKAAGGVV